MAQAKFHQEGVVLDHVADAVITSGDIIQLADGRAAVVPTVPNNMSAGDVVGARVWGVVEVDKTANIALLNGGDVYWDVSAGKAHFRPENGTGDFFLGTCVKDAAAAAAKVLVDLNVHANYEIDLHNPNLHGDGWTAENTDGLGVTSAGIVPGVYTLSFDAVAEVAQAALFSKREVLVSQRPILEARVAVFNIGDNAALDINVGLASASHATDFESIPVFAAVQLDGASLNINTHSDDGTTDRAPADSTIDAVDDTFFEVWIDCRDDTDVKFYIDGVLVNTSAAKRVLTAALAVSVAAIAHIEKTSDDTVADFRVSKLRVRTGGE